MLGRAVEEKLVNSQAEWLRDNIRYYQSCYIELIFSILVQKIFIHVRSDSIQAVKEITKSY